MTIRRPTNLFISFSADLQIDQGDGTARSQQLIGYTTQVPYSSYTTGSLELDPTQPEIALGTVSAGVFTATKPIEFRLEGNTDPIKTKMFTYNGTSTTIYVNNTGNTNATLEYILGTELI